MVWIYDIETLSNCFTYTAINRDSDETVSYVIWKNRNDLQKLITHLKSAKGLIGFNNLAFDYPVIHMIMKNADKFATYTTERLAKLIYKIAQDTIEKEWSQVREPFIPQLDLFKIWHFDNKAKMTSLKKLEIAMKFPNVQDMPYHHGEDVKTPEQVVDVLDYNLNDVKATKLFYQKSIDKIELRKKLMEQYRLNCLNYSDSKIGEELMLKLYCQKTMQVPNVIKKSRTYRNILKFSDCIPSYVNFTTRKFNDLLDYLKEIEVNEIKDSFEYPLEYKDFTFHLGTGGIHGCIKGGIYKSTDTHTIVDADVASLYPSLAVANDFYPQHLGREFSKIYNEDIVVPRLEAKRRGDKVMADGFKLSANSVYGKSNSEFSFLYDPLYTLKTTLSGQLSLCMLSEMLMTAIPELQMLQINTDGLTVIIPNEKKRLYWDICKKWESITKLTLEYVAYKQMIIRDVNTYIAESVAGKVKYKGAFKPHEEMIKDGEYYKAFNQGIVPIALSKYFTEGIPVEKTIMEHKNIYDFCKTFNATHGWKCETVKKLDDEREIDIKEEQKNNRYYISKEGKTFRKRKDERIIEIEAENLVKMFNQYQDLPFEQYEVDYNYYIDECNKIIFKIDGTEERLEQEAIERRMNKKKSIEERNYLEFCVDRIPTERMFELYKRDWLVEKYGTPKEIKPSKLRK